ncbi:histidine kinase [Candidatus Magnetomorum sp. HK-1]|nr:histidine kinase [Candidatus Magnetomorum sp. HK-1]
MDLEMNVLAVDDFDFARRIFKNVLKELGINNVTEAASGNAALNELKKKDFGLIITDYNMPGMDGIELVRKIKADDKTKDIPVIMVTSDGKKSVMLEAAEAGICGFLGKPFTKEELSEKIDKACSL